MNTVTITGGKIRSLGIERPTTDQIVTLAATAIADGFGLSGSGSIRKVTGSTITIVVSTHGCTCPLWRNGTYCHHMAMLAVKSMPVTIETRKPVPVPTPIRPRRERRGWTRRPLWVVRPPIPFRQRPTV